jgi:hypothetical protein
VTAALRVEKRKWDGSVSSVDAAELLPPTHGAAAWLVRAGAERSHPKKGTVDEVVAADEVWVAIPGEWWVLCGRLGPDRTIGEYVLHAAAPFEPPVDDTISWIDLDLDFQVHGEQSALEDETQFHEHARAMAYPDDVIVGAWAGISGIAPRFTTGEWPFDGSLASLLDHPSVGGHPSV